MTENIHDYEEEGLFVESNYKFQTLELDALSLSSKINDKDNESVDAIPMFVKLFYSIPSFSRLACLVLLRYY
jgi:hypothetical protein